MNINAHTKMIIGFVVLAIVIGAGSFFVGMKFSNKLTNAGFTRNGVRAQMMGGRLGGGVNSGMTTFGTVSKQDATGLTVTLPDGSSKIVLTSSTTKVSKTVDGTLTDVKVGDNVAVFGTSTTGGTVTATTIQLNPVIGKMMGATPSATK